MNTHEATSAPVSPMALEPLMDVAELANYLGIPVSTVYDWRVHGKGPCCVSVRQASEIRDLRRAILDGPAARTVWAARQAVS